VDLDHTVTTTKAKRRRTGLWLALFCLICWHGNSFTGSVPDLAPSRSDSWGAELTAASLVESGNFDLDEFTPPGTAVPDTNLHYLVKGRGDQAAHYYSKYPVLPPLLAWPVFQAFELAGWSWAAAVPDAVREWRLAFAGKLAATLQMALAVWVLHAVLRRFGSPASAVLGALAFGLASFGWFYSQTLWTHPSGCLFLGLLVLAAWEIRASVRACGCPARGWLLTAGAAGALATAGRYTNGLPVLILGIALLATLSDWRTRLYASGWIALGAVPFVLLQGAYNHVFFGSAFATSYAGEASGEWGGWKWQFLPWSETLTEAATMVAVWFTSPSFGLLPLAPVFGLACWGLLRGARQDGLVLGTLAAALSIAALHSLWWSAYHYVFGPRFLIDALPLLALGFAFCGWPQAASRRVAVLLLCAVGVAVQLLGIVRFHPWDHEWFDGQFARVTADGRLEKNYGLLWSVEQSVPVHLLRTPRR
jgi:hypothetical protein